MINVSQNSLVPSVNPDHLRFALEPLTAWTVAETSPDEAQTIGRSDLNEVLDGLKRKCGVDSDGAVALFKRALALLQFCDDHELPENLFDDLWPGRALCQAASRAHVIDLTGEQEGEITHSFDLAEMQAAIRAANN